MPYLNKLLCYIGWHDWVWVNLDVCICQCGKALRQTTNKEGRLVWERIDTRD